MQIARQVDGLHCAAAHTDIADLDNLVPWFQSGPRRWAPVRYADQADRHVAIDVVGDAADNRRRDRVPEKMEHEDIDGKGRGPNRGMGHVGQDGVRRAGIEEEEEHRQEDEQPVHGKGNHEEEQQTGHADEHPDPGHRK